MERYIALLCKYQRAWADVEALVCSRSLRSRQVMREGTLVHEVAEWGRFQSAPLSPLFPLYMRLHRADVIVVHVPNPTAELGYLIGRPRGTLIVRYHSDVVRQAAAYALYRPLQVHFLRQAAMILPTSERYLNSSPILPRFRSRCRVVPLGIVPEDFQNPNAERVAALRTTYGGDFVLFAGRHRYYKGLPYLVQAAQELSVPVVIAGEGPERSKCMALAKELGVQVHFPGTLTQEALVDHLHACAVFAFPSIERSEAFGMAIMEAHACGKPVVATTLGTGVEFLNLQGESGLNVAPRDPAALAEALNALLGDPERRRAMGAFARDRIATEFDIRQVARREFELYQEALACGPTST